MSRVLVKVVAMDTRTWVAHSHCNLDKEELLERKVEAIHIPDMTDSPLEADNQAFGEGNLQRVHYLELVVGNYTLEVDNPVADIQGKVDKVDMQAEKEALLTDVTPESQKRVRDRMFEDQHVFLEQHQWQDVEVSQSACQLPPAF